MWTAALLLSLADAEACGGFFCNSQAQPIDQAGERIVFALDEGHVDVHVQISYTGTADSFAWLVPAPAVPELFLSTDELFRVLDRATAPRFQLNYQMEEGCPRSRGGKDDGGASFDSDDVFEDTSGGPQVTVASEAQLGPYETVVLQGTSSAAILDWLQAHEYLIPDDIGASLDPYVATGSWFVALRLQKDRGTGELTPLGMRYAGTEPVIPLTLTRIAAVPDMPLIPWVFGPGRAVPENYLHVQINQAAIDWPNSGANYSSVVGQAADEAGGQAFATDFSGSPASMSGQLLRNGRFDLTALQTAPTPEAFVFRVLQQGFPRGELLYNLLDDLVPDVRDRAAEISADTGIFAGDTDPPLPPEGTPPFDAAPWVELLRVSFIEPLERAEALFNLPWVTRMTSSASPSEMNLDPRFVINPDLPSVPQTRTATWELDCDGDNIERLILSDGTVIAQPTSAWLQAHGEDSDSWADPFSEHAAATIEQTGRSGSPTTITDNREAIQAAIDSRNREVGLRRALNSGGCGCATTGDGSAAVLALALLLRRRR